MTQNIERFVSSWFFPALASVGVLMAALLLSPGAHANARSHQNLRAPMQCAALDAGTPAFRDCMDKYAPANSSTVAVDTPLRGKPDPYSPAIGTLAKGTEVLMLERVANGFWYRVRAGDLEGYVPFEVLDLQK